MREHSSTANYAFNSVSVRYWPPIGPPERSRGAAAFNFVCPIPVASPRTSAFHVTC
jgi:hypothetical protein